jgi:hypothetical protein
MSSYVQTTTFESLNLPPELEEITGLVETDLRAIVAIITAGADSRLFLTRREIQQLQRNLWNRLVGVINTVSAPLTTETR